MKLVRILCLMVMLVTNGYATDQMAAINIQTSMTSSQIASFGRITPYEVTSIGNVMINPASIGGIEFNQLSLSTLQLSSEIDYQNFMILFPFGDYTYSFSYGTNVTGGFIETDLVNDVVMDIGEFSSGFNVLHLAVGTKMTNSFLIWDHFYYGFGFHMLTQVIENSARSPAYGVDVGFIMTSFFNRFAINRLDLGFSIVDAFSTGLPAWTYDSDVGESLSQDVERQIYVGSKLTMLDYTLGFHNGINFHDFQPRDLMIGFDYQYAQGLDLRASAIYDMYQTYDFTYNLGLGLMLKRVAGVGSYLYDMSLDYTYTMYPYPRTYDPSHTISLTFLGHSADQRPRVLSPSSSFVTDTPFVSFNGNANQNSLIYIYNNETIVGNVQSDANGKWEVKGLSLNDGYNSITFRSKSGNNDFSDPSYPVIVNYDTTPPIVETKLNVMSNMVSIELFSNEPLQDSYLVFDGKKIPFIDLNDNHYSVSLPLPDNMVSGQPIPEKMVSYDLYLIDRVGNQSKPETISFFVEPFFPLDQSVVYNDAITAVGYASSYVDSMEVNGSLISLDKNNGFSKSIQLDYGKQLVTFDVYTDNNRKITYYARLLCMKRFEDIPKFAKYRRDIEFLATLGYIFGQEDGLFHPEDEMTRRDLAVAIAKYKKLEPKELDYDPYLDLPMSDPDAGIILAAIEEGIIYAFADGNFQPDDLVSVADAFKMLNNSGVIDSEDVVVSEKPIKRYEFALFFKQTRRYDQRIQYLIDWDQGYDLP